MFLGIRPKVHKATGSWREGTELHSNHLQESKIVLWALRDPQNNSFRGLLS